MAAEAEVDQARFERTTVDIKPLKASNVPIIFVIGGPGCGKGTQCERIVKRYGFTHLSTGDLLREEVESGSKRGQKMSAIMKKGELVPLDVVLDLLKEAMMKHLPKTKGYLIDGFPREIAQGVEFEKQIKPCTMVLFFDVSDKTMLERCLKRGQTSGRVDDNEDTIKKRLATFHGVSKPVVEFYKNKVKIINGDRSIDEVFVNASEYLNQVIFPPLSQSQAQPPKMIVTPPAKLPIPTSTRLMGRSEDRTSAVSNTSGGIRKLRKDTPWVNMLLPEKVESWETIPSPVPLSQRPSKSTTQLLRESITILERIKSERSLYEDQDKNENIEDTKSEDLSTEESKTDEISSESQTSSNQNESTSDNNINQLTPVNEKQ